MFLPLHPDVPTLRRPLGTLVLMVLEIVAFAVMAWLAMPTFDRDISVGVPNQWSLVHGYEVFPRQWLTALFVHRTWWQLAISIYFLWTFGLVAEGKIGWWFFVPLFLAVGVGANALEQHWMLDSETAAAHSFGPCAARSVRWC